MSAHEHFEKMDAIVGGTAVVVPPPAPGSAPSIGAFALPLTSTEALANLCNEVPIDIPRFILGQMLGCIDSWCSEADLDVKTVGDRAYITPRRCTMNDRGQQALTKGWSRALQNEKAHPTAAKATVDGTENL